VLATPVISGLASGCIAENGGAWISRLCRLLGAATAIQGKFFLWWCSREQPEIPMRAGPERKVGRSGKSRHFHQVFVSSTGYYDFFEGKLVLGLRFFFLSKILSFLTFSV
jgi:hypothetical protein